MKKRIVAVVCGIVGVVGCLYLVMCVALNKAYKMEQQYRDYYMNH